MFIVLPHKLVDMNINPNDKVFQNVEPNFYRDKEHMWGPNAQCNTEIMHKTLH